MVDVAIAPAPRPALWLGPVMLRMDDRSAYLREQRLPLTRMEYRIFELLARRKGRTVTEGAIYDALYGADPNGRPDTPVIKVLVCKMRRKLREAGCPPVVGTVWGIGYIAKDPEPADMGVPAHG